MYAKCSLKRNVNTSLNLQASLKIGLRNTIGQTVHAFCAPLRRSFPAMKVQKRRLKSFEKVLKVPRRWGAIFIPSMVTNADDF